MDRKLIAFVGGAAVILAGLVFWAVSGGKETAQETPTVAVAEPEKDTAKTTDLSKPYFDTIRISRQGTGVIAGGQSPGARIVLFANNQRLDEVIADENGEFVIVLNKPLEPGPVEFNLHGYPAGSSIFLEPDELAVTRVAERDVRQFVEKSQNDTITALVDKDGDKATRVIQQPAGPALTAGLVIQTVDFGGGSETIVAGSAIADGRVALYLDDRFVGSATANVTGRWEVRFKDVISEGQHSLKADQLLEDGKVQLRAIQPFEAGSTIDSSTASAGVVIKSGNTLWQIARLVYGGGKRFALIFKGNSEQISDPDMIFPGQVFELPIEANKKEDA